MAEAKLSSYDELVKEAQGAGVDPRSIEYFQSLQKTATENKKLILEH